MGGKKKEKLRNPNLVEVGLHETKLYIDIEPHQWPIIFRSEYDVHFMGLEKLHPFDSSKWGNIFRILKESRMVNENTITKPNEAQTEDLLVIHTQQYLNSLQWSWNVAKIAEIPPLAIVPNFLVQMTYLRPMRYQTGGTILAGKLALERGWAINIGGGFHHCSSDRGGGFCSYADISLLIKFLFLTHPEQVKNVMIVDLDAHQGNGHERDFLNRPEVYIFDMYNKSIYPRDSAAKAGARRRVELAPLTEDDEYLTKLEIHSSKALQEFHPDILVYNAGTDILEGDPLGLLSITSTGIIRRDEIVFTKARQQNIPIVMVTSGGYLKKTAHIIAMSILNLRSKGLIGEMVPQE